MAELTRAPTPSEATVTLVESEEDHKQLHCAVNLNMSGLITVFSRVKAGNISLLQRNVVTFISNRFIGTAKVLNSTSEEAGLLDGIKILDLTRIVAGPFCTMALGDLGADVIKIERPGTGDEARKWGPPFLANSSESCYFISLNRNKKSVCIDLKSKEGQNIVHELASKCDVLVENYVSGKLSKLNLSYEDLNKKAPHLIYCSVTGYGPDGPYANRPGYDAIAASVGGLLHITGPHQGEPCKVGVAMVDLATGLYAHGAILAALFQRTLTGKGQKIDCNLLSTQVACLINIGSNYLNVNKEAQRWGTAHESIVPYESFPTSDGEYLTVGTGSDQQFAGLCVKLNLKELATDARFCTNHLRVQNREVLIRILQQQFMQKTLKEWLSIMEGSPFPYGPVNNMAKVFSDPHIQDIGLVKEMQHPTAGNIKVVGPPVKFSGGLNIVRSPPPLLGQHTDQVLSEVLSYSPEQLQKLKASSVIHQA